MKIFDTSSVMVKTNSIKIGDDELEIFDQMLTDNGVDHCFTLAFESDFDKERKPLDGEKAIPAYRVLHMEEDNVMFGLTFVAFYKRIGVSDEKAKSMIREFFDSLDD